MNEEEKNFATDTGPEALQAAHSLFDSQNYSEAAKAYLGLADGPYGRAVYLRLGWMCEWGMGLEKDPQKAEYWYERAAQAGIPEGHYRIGLMRLRAEKLTAAKPYMERAAEGDRARAFLFRSDVLKLDLMWSLLGVLFIAMVNSFVFVLVARRMLNVADVSEDKLRGIAVKELIPAIPLFFAAPVMIWMVVGGRFDQTLYVSLPTLLIWFSCGGGCGTELRRSSHSAGRTRQR